MKPMFSAWNIVAQVLVLQSCFKPGINATETFKLRKVALESRQWEENVFLSCFPSLKPM
jgi:hypothetical protein